MRADRCVITIGGDLGSGKSTVARMLADVLHLERFSTGDLQRRMAQDMGITSLDLNRLAETDESIDRKIDGSTLELAGQYDRILFDSRLAYHFVPDSFKVYLSVDPRIGAERIFGAERGRVETYSSLEEACRQLSERRESETRRYRELYGVNPECLDIYNMVIDTSLLPADIIAELIAKRAEANGAGDVDRAFYLSPRTPLPTSGSRLEENRSPRQTPTFVRAGRHYFIYRGAPVVSGAITAGDGVIRGELVAGLEQSQLEEYVERECRDEDVREWEARHGFQFPSYPPHLRR